jgi:Ser/Thr protein kinase RdoA (MazF antagonist)
MQKQPIRLKFTTNILVPIRASSGETFITVETDGPTLHVALLPRLVGQPMDRQNLNQVQAAGSALAKLHRQLANFDPQGQFARILDRLANRRKGKSSESCRCGGGNA